MNFKKQNQDCHIQQELDQNSTQSGKHIKQKRSYFQRKSK